MQTINENVTLIIRSVGERTEQACFNLLKKVFHESHIMIVRETPFSESIRQSFKIAIDRALPWTLCIDADVLVDIEQLSTLIQKAIHTDDNVLQMQGLVLDKFIPVIRPAGNHLYRTALLGKALEFIPEEGTSLRPETDMLNEMSKQGYPWLQCDVLVGIHDFEQYFEDIYRKCFLQAHKHNYLIPLIEPYWIEKSRYDLDFKVAVLALRSGKVYGEKLFIDKNFLKEEAIDVLSMKHIQEKTGNFELDTISDIIQEYQESDFLKKNQEKIFHRKNWNSLKVFTKSSEVKSQKPLRIKVIRFVLYRLGFLIEQVGIRIKNI
jgi:hypothetical protein